MIHLAHRSVGVVGLSAAALLGAAAPGAHASIVSYSLVFTGSIESPPNSSGGIGSGTIVYDNVAHTLQLSVIFSGLSGTTTNSHIHAATASPFSGTAGVATTQPTFAGFPMGVTSGSFNSTLDLTLASSFNPAFVTANGGTLASAELALANSMAAGTAYWNIHSSFASGGEIRGFTPAPGAAGLLGLAGLVLTRRRR